MRDFAATKQTLCDLVRVGNVELLMGSGTLANDVIGAQLSLEGKPGLVLSNGEFGNRLVDQARRFRLDFKAAEFPWGQPFDLGMVRKALEQICADTANGRAELPLCPDIAGKDAGGTSGQSVGLFNAEEILAARQRQPAAFSSAWLWCVHCETSTSVLNDLDALKALCAEFNVRLCLDCISSIGTMPLELTGVFLASASSGKGLRAYPGISMVFHHHEIVPQPERLPRYLDLGYYAEQQGVPFTFSSNLLHALHAAVKHVEWDRRFTGIVELSAFLRAQLVELGFELVGTPAGTSPAVITIALPPEMNSVKVGELIQEAGYLLSCNSEYLRRKNWIQICLMGECTKEKAVSLLNAMKRICGRARKAETVAK
jgi:aspartate aminotransferase-like enzyme